jgi:hypothetical protein
MTNALITKSGSIRVGHAVREDFSGCSSGNGRVNYYGTKGCAVSAYSAVLRAYGLCFDTADMICMLGDDGRINIDIYTDDSECARFVGCAMLMWHKMEVSGRWEFTGYLA